MSEPQSPRPPAVDPAARARRNRMLGLILAAVAVVLYFAISVRWGAGR